MTYILGIDTGGTYTDGVILDDEKRKVIAKAKALTTYDNLVRGIRHCIDNLGFTDPALIKGVSLSTTLATNAIVEGRGCEVGLLLIGRQTTDKVPTQYVEFFQGGHDVKGNRLAELDLAEASRAVEHLRGKVQAIAISGYFSVRNPEHEILVRDIVTEKLGIPVVCAHQLTTALGFHERTVTAVLNAKLIPIITDLLESVKTVMADLGIKAPLMIVKGNGTLMSEEMAKTRPIDTILSGPAASIIGSTVLAGAADAVVVDMGGTTTDIAILKEGIPRINPEGATVGSWLTRVEAAEVYTYGIGGDSYIRLNADGEIVIGPQKVWPLAVMAYSHPHLLKEIKDQADKKRAGNDFLPTDCFMLVKDPPPGIYSNTESAVIGLLKDKPHTLVYLLENLSLKNVSLKKYINIQRLVDLGVLAKISLTPTDLMHAQGIYAHWNTEAARLGVDIMAKEMGVQTDEFLSLAMKALTDKISLSILQSLFSHEGSPVSVTDEKYRKDIFGKVLSPQTEDVFNIEIHVRPPLIAIGAPVRAYLPKVAEKLHAELVIPQHAEVANAIGAAGGKVMEKVNIHIKPLPEGGFIVHAPWERKIFAALEEAKNYAVEQGKERVSKDANQAGAEDFRVFVNCKDHCFKANNSWDREVYLETDIEITAVGNPSWS